MTAITTPRFKESTDSLLRFAMRADAICSGLMGIAGIPLAGWLAKTSGTPIAFEYAVSASFIVFAVGVLWLAPPPSVPRAGVTLAVGVYTLIMAELQYQGWRRVK